MASKAALCLRGSLVRNQNQARAAWSSIAQQRRGLRQKGALRNVQVVEVEHANHEEDGEDEAHFAPWQTLLGTASRAAWRASEPHPPQNLADAQESLLEKGQRTSRQLRRTHQRVLNAHSALAQRRERERQRAKSRLARPDSLANKADMARDAAVKPVYYGPEQTLSNLRHRLLPNYAIVKRVLMETQSLMGQERWSPERIIDFGIGCGSASAAALDVFPNVDWVHGIDPSRSMRDGAEHMLKQVVQGRHVESRVTLNSSLSTDTTGSEAVGFDLALFAYTATELPHAASTLAAAAALWEKLRPNGIFVMIEPGTPDGFNSVRSVRSMLLDCCPPGESEEPGTDECHIIAPCTHNQTCPMERHRRMAGRDRPEEGVEEYEEYDIDDDYDTDDDDKEDWVDDDGDEADTFKITMAETDVFKSAFCSFVHTMPGSHHRSKGEKFSYLVAQKRIFGDPETNEERLDQLHNEFHDTNVVELLGDLTKRNKQRDVIGGESHNELMQKAENIQMRYLDSEDDIGLELIRGDKNRNSFGRIIRAPLKRRGHVLLDYCGASKGAEEGGRIVRHRISKGWSARVAPGMFAAARKARWGGLWPDNHLDPNTSNKE